MQSRKGLPPVASAVKEELNCRPRVIMDHMWFRVNEVTNTNYQASFYKHWQAAGHTSIAQLLQAYSGEGTPTMPKMGDQMVCLSWILKGWCFDNCGQSSTHKQASSALPTQVHALLDSCGIPPAN